MVRIVRNNPFPTIDVVPESVDLSSCKKEIEELIAKKVFKKIEFKSHDRISLTVTSKKSTRRFKVIRDRQGNYSAELNVKARKDIQAQLKRGHGAIEKYIINEVFRRCVERIEAAKNEHAVKALQKAVKKH